jgi:hypothetical protein
MFGDFGIRGTSQAPSTITINFEESFTSNCQPTSYTLYSSSCYCPQNPTATLSLSTFTNHRPLPRTKTHTNPTNINVKLFSQITDELAHIFTLPQYRPLENVEIIRQLPPGHPLRPFYLDVITGSDNVPLLSMSGEEEHNVEGEGAGERRSPESGSNGGTQRRKDNARTRVEGLSNSVPEGTMTGGKTFDQLPLREKKAVLIDRELE